MPSTKKVLVNLDASLHEQVRRRMKRERRRWPDLLHALLQQWVDGGTGKEPVRGARAPARASVPVEALMARWQAEDPVSYARVQGQAEIVEGYSSVGALLAAEAARKGQPLPPEVALPDDNDE